MNKDSELKIRPEYLRKLKKIMKGKHYSFRNINELRRQIEKDK